MTDVSWYFSWLRMQWFLVHANLFLTYTRAFYLTEPHPWTHFSVPPIPVKDGTLAPSLGAFSSQPLHSFNISCMLSQSSVKKVKYFCGKYLSFCQRIALLLLYKEKPKVDGFYLSKHRWDLYKRRRKEERMKDSRHFGNDSFSFSAKMLIGKS